jgi:hypothetical protein
MQNPLFWIEWLDRLDRVLGSARQDIASLKRTANPRSIEAIDRSKRQLAGLINDLRLLDPDVLAASAKSGAQALQSALETTVVAILRKFRLRARQGCSIACLRPATPLCAIAATKLRCC